MAKLKSTFTDASVEAYIASRANEQQEADCRPLACFAIRGKDLVVYLYANEPKQKALLSKVGKFRWASPVSTSGSSLISIRQCSRNSC